MLLRHAPEVENFYNEWPEFDFGGLFYAIAMKQGGSEICHLDMSDLPKFYCFVILAGDWEGGALCLPQLGRRIPTHAGQVILFLAVHWPHFAAQITSGRRIAFTGFIDGELVKAARDNWVVRS